MARRLCLVLLLSLGACRRAPSPPAPAAAVSAQPAPVLPPTIALERETSIRESQGLVLARVNGVRHAFIADEDDGAIVDVDLETQVAHSMPLRTRPRDLLILSDGTIAATLPDASAVVVLAREVTGGVREVRRATVPAEPMAIGLSPDDTRLYVSTGASHSLVALDPKLEEHGRWNLAREPRAVLVSRDGDRVFVSHAAESVLSVLRGGELTTTRIHQGTQCAGESCESLRVARHADALVRIGERGLVIPAARVLPNPPLDQGITDVPSSPSKADVGFTGYGLGPFGGPPSFMDLSTFDESELKQIGSGTMVFEGTTCLLPRAAVAASDFVFVACQGSAMIEQHLNPHGMHSPATIHRRIRAPSGPSAIAAERGEERLVVWSAFARTLSELELGPQGVFVAQKPMPEGMAQRSARRGLSPKPIASLTIPRVVAREEAWLRGRELFYSNVDPRISGDGRACASCHVEGRDDGLTWSTPMGPRRTRLLAGQLAQGPYGWRGEHPTLEAHVRVTFKQLRGSGLPDAELESLLTYVRALPRPPAPLAAAEQGKRIFDSAECGNCHANGGSDRNVHDVGTGGSFLTPALAGIGSRRQLMHDGRYATLDQLLVGAKAMGAGSSLSEGDRRALVGYLETL